jgi:hypothetical protein
MRRNEQETHLEADRLFAGVFALDIGKNVRPQVAQLEADQDFPFLIDGLLAAENQVPRFLAGDAAIEAHVGNVITGPVEGRDVAGEEGFALLGLHFTDAVEITDSGGMQIEIGFLLGCARSARSAHGESPWKKSGDTPGPGGKGVQAPRGSWIGTIRVEEEGIATVTMAVRRGCRSELVDPRGKPRAAA